MPFFENTKILRRDVQVLDHILTMEIKTRFILNLPRPKITTANACATRPPLPLGFTGGEDATNILTIIYFGLKYHIKKLKTNKILLLCFPTKNRCIFFFLNIKFLQSPSFSFLFFDNISSLLYPIEGVFILNIKFQIM